MSVNLTQYVPFATDVSHSTGLDFYTVLGWVGAEGGPPGNPLNIGPGANYGDEAHAAAATSQLIHTGAYAGLLAAANARYASEDQAVLAEAHAIAVSPWKGNDGLPRAQYEKNITSQALIAMYEKITPRTTIDPSGADVNPTGPTIDNPLGGLSGFFDTLTSSATWIRVGLGAGGLALIVVGAYTMFK